MRVGVVLVARRVLVTEAVENRLQGVEREVETAVAVVIARDGHHRRPVVGVLLQRLLRELLRRAGVALDRFDFGERRDDARRIGELPPLVLQERLGLARRLPRLAR